MSYLFMIIVLIGLIILLLPYLFTLIFKRILGFTHASLKLKHPFKYMGTFLQYRQPLWAIELFTLYIPVVRV